MTNETTDKGFILKINTQLTQHNTRKTNNAIKKWSKDLNTHVSKKKKKKTSRQFSSVQSCLALCDPMDCSTPGFLVLTIS